MTKSAILLLAIATLASSCKVIEIDDLRPGPVAIDTKLPPLESYLDQRSIELSYDILNTSTSGSIGGLATGLGEGWILGTGDIDSRSISQMDRRIRDLTTIWDRDVHQNISRPGVPRGSIVLSVPYKETRPVAMGWTILSGATLFIPNLFGMPLIKQRTELELVATIYDCNDVEIARYLGYGNAKIKMAINGYGGDIENMSGNDNISRKSHIDAVKQALQEIKEQVNSDTATITQALQSCVEEQ